jgi:hypothetical protein
MAAWASFLFSLVGLVFLQFAPGFFLKKTRGKFSKIFPLMWRRNDVRGRNSVGP